MATWPLSHSTDAEKMFLEVGTYLSYWKRSARQAEITDQADHKDYNHDLIKAVRL